MTETREEFEAWAKTKGWGLNKGPAGVYKTTHTYMAWLAWQAALTHGQAVTPSLYPPEFESFWGVVAKHKRKSKKDAHRRYKEAVRILKGIHPDPHSFLMGRAAAYYRSPLGLTEFCNGPAPWLHQGGYDDDPAAWERQETSTQYSQKEVVYRDSSRR